MIKKKSKKPDSYQLRLNDLCKLLAALKTQTTHESLQTYLKKAPTFKHNNKSKADHYENYHALLLTLSSTQLQEEFNAYIEYLQQQIQKISNNNNNITDSELAQDVLEALGLSKKEL